MNLYEVMLLGIGLAMDAFAVAICKGLTMKRLDIKNALLIAGFFGGFQALMPLIGWLLGTGFAKYIEAYDHWIAFGLLAFIGGKMILDAIRDLRNPEEQEHSFSLHLGELTLLAIATSIDALAVGLTFAMLKVGMTTISVYQISIWLAILIIGLITFLISLAGVMIGFRFGDRFHAKAEIVGGIILILIGIKILIEHLT